MRTPPPRPWPNRSTHLIDIREVDPAGPAARACLTAYYAELGQRMSGGFEVSRSRDPRPADMLRPRGAFLVAFRNDQPLACVALKGTDEGYAEVKRLWVAPEARGVGLAARLMREVEAIARDLGVDRLRLDTNRALTDAVAMYRRWGWIEIVRFNDDPYADFFFEKRLAPSPAQSE